MLPAEASAVGTASEQATSHAGPKVPAFCWWWLSAITISLMGSQIQSFALGWTATADGASLAALVLTAGSIPSITLMLIGGAVADSRGPWLNMVISDAAMCLVTAILLIAIVLVGTPVWLLFSAAVLVGMSNAYFMPSSCRPLGPSLAVWSAMQGWVRPWQPGRWQAPWSQRWAHPSEAWWWLLPDWEAPQL